MPRPALTLVSAAVVAAVALSGCGSSAGPSATAGGTGTTGVSASSTPAGGDAKVGDSVPAADLAARSAAAAKAAKTSHVDITGKDATEQMAMDVDYTSNDFAMTMKLSEGTISIRKVGNVMYMGGMPGMPGGKKWVKLDGKGDDPLSSLFSGLVGAMGQATDTNAYLAVDGLQSTVVAVDGDTVTYESSLTAAQLSAVTAKVMAKIFPSGLPSSAPTPGAGSMKITQTLDASGLPTKVVVDSVDSGKSSVMTMVYSDWGKAVDVSAPPAAETLSIADLMKTK